MPPIARVFPNVQRLLVVALEDLAGGSTHTGIETPDDLAQILPFIRVTGGTGPSDRLNAYPRFDVDVFHSSFDAGQQLAEDVRQWLCGPPPPIPQLDRCDCDSGPHELPWNDQPNLRRFGLIFTFTARRVARPA